MVRPLQLECINAGMATTVNKKLNNTMRPEVKYYTKTPDQIPSLVIQELIGLVKTGGEVDNSQVETNILRAGMISYVTVGGKVAGLVVLKRPNTSYRNKVFQASGAEENANNYPLEVGYVYTLPEIRGTKIIYNAFKQFTTGKYGNVFATVREDNYKAIRLLQRSGYKNIGNPYKSARGDYNLLLWVSN